MSVGLLAPQEAAVENVGPVDDGTESLGDAPSLSEDVTGIGRVKIFGIWLGL